MTIIKFSLPVTETAYVSLFNISGEQVAVLFDGLAENNTIYNLEFDAANLASGVYYYRLVTKMGTYTQKLVLY